MSHINILRMKIVYYLNEGRKKNLYCRISDGTIRVTFSLDYTVEPEKWNSKKNEVDPDDLHFFTLINFKKYLTKKYHELKNEGKDDVLIRLKNEALSFTQDSGIDGIAKILFNLFNEGTDMLSYDNFIQAFEKFSNLKKGVYKVETIDTTIHFHTKEEIFEMDTYEGLTYRLKSFIKQRSYEEIYIMTNMNIWNEIFIDPGIEKQIFLPEMLREWEIYWDDKYQEIREKLAKTSHLDELKQQSWRQFQVYMGCFDASTEVIRLAFTIDEDILYPISVISMMNIFDVETCCTEYCEQEFFGSGEWESICINEDDDNSPMCFVRVYE